MGEHEIDDVVRAQRRLEIVRFADVMLPNSAANPLHVPLQFRCGSAAWQRREFRL
jgi:hypothetical protein